MADSGKRQPAAGGCLSFESAQGLRVCSFIVTARRLVSEAGRADTNGDAGTQRLALTHLHALLLDLLQLQ